MPKKIPKELIEKWKELRKQGHSCEKIGEMTGGYSRRTVEKYSRELKEEKRRAETEGFEDNIFLYLQRWGELLRQRCPHAKRIIDGFCPQAEFPIDEWGLELSKKIFQDVVIVKRGKKELVRPKIPAWYCAFCWPIKSVERKAGEVDAKLGGTTARMRSWATSRLSEQQGFIERLKDTLIKESAEAGTTAAWKVIKNMDSIINEMTDLPIFLGAYKEAGGYRKQTCRHRNPTFCTNWIFWRVPKFALKTVLYKGRYMIDPHPCWCAMCPFYKP